MKIYYKDGYHMDPDPVPEGAVEITLERYRELIGSGKHVDIGPSGLPEVKPTAWHTLNEDGTKWEVTPENQTAKDALYADHDRRVEIRDEKEAAGLKNISLQEAYDFIGRTDDIKLILKKMIPYILK